jgi:uncharacterized membrane protein
MTGREAQHLDAERRHGQKRELATFVIALALALSAFSLTDAVVHTARDVAEAVGFFAIAFFFVISVWGSIAWLFDYYPPGEPWFYRGVLLVLFLTSVAPFFLSLLLAEAQRVEQLGQFLLPADLAAIELVIVGLRLHLLCRHGSALADAVREEGWHLLTLNTVVVAIFLVSLLLLPLPVPQTVLSLCWVSNFVLPRLVVRLPQVEQRLHRIAARGSEGPESVADRR